MKKIWILLLLFFLFFMNISFALNKGKGAYEYDTRNLPKVWFFPEEKAKWNGLKIKVKDWKILDNDQKRKFVEEYTQDALSSLLDDYIIMQDIDPNYHLMALKIFVAGQQDESVDMQTLLLTSLIANGDIEKRVKG